MSPQYTSVYLMQITGTDYYKVGISCNVRARRRCIQSSLPFDIALIRSVEKEDAARVEEAIHAALHAYHIRGEWFACGHEEVCRVFDLHTLKAETDVAISQHKHTAPRIRVATPAMITEARDLHKYHAVSHGHIARLLGISRTTVSNILNRKGRYST